MAPSRRAIRSSSAARLKRRTRRTARPLQASPLPVFGTSELNDGDPLTSLPSPCSVKLSATAGIDPSANTTHNATAACRQAARTVTACLLLTPELMKTGISSRISFHAVRKRSTARRRRGQSHRLRNVRPRPVKHFTKEETESFFGAIPEGNIRDLLLFDLMYRHGLRRGEAALLELGDIKGNQIFVPRLKGGDAHWHPLHPRSRQLLRAYLAVRPPDRCPYLFRGKRRGGQPLSEETINYLFQRYATAAGLPRELRHAHVLRHSIGVHLATAGWDIADVQWWLGHRDIESTAIYFQVMPERVATKYRMLLRSRSLAHTGRRARPQRSFERQLARTGGFN
jgi:integrase